MSRNLIQSVNSEISQDEISVFWACDLLFDSPNQLYFWTGLGDLTLDGNTYKGAGELMSVGELRESSDIASYGATLTLSAISKDFIGDILSEPYQGRKARVKLGFNISGVRSAVTLFTGEMDQMNISYGPDSVTVSLYVENRLVDLSRPRIRRYSHEDQRSRFPDDKAFEFLTRIQEEVLEWKAT